MTKTAEAGTNSKSWRETVLDFRSCNAEIVGAEWSADKRDGEQIGLTTW